MSLEEIPLYILCTADGYGSASKVSFHREMDFCSNSRSYSLRRIIAIANPVFMWRLSSEELRMFWHYQTHCFFISVRKRGSYFRSFFVDGESGAHDLTVWPKSLIQYLLMLSDSEKFMVFPLWLCALLLETVIP